MSKSGLPPVIDGKTRLFGTIGDPIEHVGSPGVMTARLQAGGLNAVFLPMHVKPERFDETIRGLKALGNLDGFIITLPYKARIIPFADRISPRARRIGAINAMRRMSDGSWIGDMFDGRGLVRGLLDHGIDPGGRRVLLLGAGGAGSAIGDALAEAHVAALTIFDTDETKARTLADNIGRSYPSCRAQASGADPRDHDILINATPAGMASGDAPPIPLDGLTSSLIVVDIVLNEHGTSLLAHAEACGCRTVGGMAMIEGQAAEFMDFFRPAAAGAFTAG